MEQRISEQGVRLNVSRDLSRKFIVSTFINSALTGDVSKFAQTFPALDWPGAWREAFTQLVDAGIVNSSIPLAFMENWRRMKAKSRARMQNHTPVSVPDWHLERDFDGHRDLMVEGLKLLMPPHTPRQHPLVLYRGQRLEDHHAGDHGLWWVACPIFAEMFGRMPSRTRHGTGVVVMTVDPHAAIIGEFDGEYLVDPRLLDGVQIVSTLMPHLDGDMDDPDRAFLMRGIPDGFDSDGLLEWLDQGRLVEGLQTVRDGRAGWIKGLVLGLSPVPA